MDPNNSTGGFKCSHHGSVQDMDEIGVDDRSRSRSEFAHVERGSLCGPTRTATIGLHGPRNGITGRPHVRTVVIANVRLSIGLCSRPMRSQSRHDSSKERNRDRSQYTRKMVERSERGTGRMRRWKSGPVSELATASEPTAWEQMQVCRFGRGHSRRAATPPNRGSRAAERGNIVYGSGNAAVSCGGCPRRPCLLRVSGCSDLSKK